MIPPEPTEMLDAEARLLVCIDRPLRQDVLSRLRRDVHDRCRASGRRRLVATLKAAHAKRSNQAEVS
jgi:hypothetical protein